ncbi:hypothetical protein, variant [Gaeumannomyces tritici R3-111a-1]|uniref:DUF6594 domain-containing protein n=1 Tax=Gaeumannomyces tritici (strain R3-111a-1) TaxID=644352 RepID=J3NMT6_GAET3|nr:hypothetical protein GGTG_02595 [Gaeumannomyces tritici R3-111a-1]XP_009218632.1 hypothetical protein, variant [Gaeumannomyces tritici R3-111a-1]EJT77486.1 hypothetical protein, variant [Gaeumannomyces tritici R3-111a-1]EJT77487.1 hypothetical protein GGTG_02595 [Gaeumannomyces tritici R3-111a-1]
MPAQPFDLDAAEQGMARSSTSSTAVHSDLEDFGIKELTIPAMQAVYLDIRCFPVFPEAACDSIHGLASGVYSLIKQKNDLMKLGVGEKCLSSVQQQTTEALEKYYSFLALANKVLGFETPSSASLKELGAFYRQQHLAVPEAIRNDLQGEYRLINPKREKHEKELIKCWHNMDWEKWFAWARMGNIQGDGWLSGSTTFSDRKVMVLAGALRSIVVCLAVVVPMAVVPLGDLSTGVALMVCLLLLLIFGGVQMWLFANHEMSFLVYAGFLATILQVKTGG